MGARSALRRWWKWAAAAGLLALLAAALLAPATHRAEQTGPVPTYTARRGELVVTVTEQGALESSKNVEIKCKVRGQSTIIWVVDNGTIVKPGDVLVKLDTKEIEDAIAERTKYAYLTRSGAERARADVTRARLAIDEYLNGRYRTELMDLQKDLAIAEANLRTARSMLAHAQMMAERGYVSKLEVEEKQLAVKQAELAVEAKKTQIDVLQRFTKDMELVRLRGELEAAEARLAAEEERARMDEARRQLALKEYEYCVIKADRPGLVIYPKTARWKDAPDIHVGATVHKDQILLLMPDVTKMQVRVGIHESVIERIKPGQRAEVTLPDRTLEGTVSFVSPVTRPAGWWTGNVVKFDTIVKLPETEGLKPGMTAEVKIVLDRYKDVLLIPVGSVLETIDGDFCWVKTPQGLERRRLQLGEANEELVIVKSGVQEGEQVVLDPLAYVPEAQRAALKPPSELRKWRPARIAASRPAHSQPAP